MWTSKKQNGYTQHQQQQSPPYNVGTAAPQHAPNVPQPAVPYQAQTLHDPIPAQMPTAATNLQAPAAPPSQMAQPTRPHVASLDFNEFIDTKISKVDAKNKVLDFSDALVRAYPKDFANIHGVGGKKHAPNSGICVTLCDYSKGTGEGSSVTTKFIIDVRQIDRLLCAAEAAMNGTLGLMEQLRAVREFATANGITISWLQRNQPPTMQEVAYLQRVLCAGLTAQDPDNKTEKVLYSYEAQKNNPYKPQVVNGQKFAPVSTLSIQYIPARKYPWIIKVVNFMAPINEQANGAVTHNNKGAINKKEAIFPMSAADFFCALSDVSHYIKLWEYRMYPTVNAMCTERERRAEAKRQQQKYA